MKIDQLQEKLENLKYSTGIKNGNELYVSVPKTDCRGCGYHALYGAQAEFRC